MDDREGNWAEGLTAYLADHLIQEQRGRGAEHRRTALQSYADYVAQAEDFPLSAFRARHRPASEAVGYGKAMLFFHMLRRRLGDGAFIAALRDFYREHRFERAAFADLRAAFARHGDGGLEAEFRQWVTRTGAPELRVAGVRAARLDDAFLLEAVLEQTQPGPPYRLQVPIAVHLEGHDRAYQTVLVMEGKRLELAVRLPARPLYFDIDPEFDLFRRLDRREIPPALSRAFGTQGVLIVLPGQGPDELRAGWRQLAQHWPGARTGEVEVVTDTELKALPSRAVWLFGWENGLLPALRAALAAYDVAITEDGVRVAGQMLRRAEHSVVLTARHPGNPDTVLAWVATAHAAALPGLGRKLPHYGQYSYLGFAGAEPTNIVKGQWPVTDSPLAVALPQPEGTLAAPPRSALERRRPLAELPPLFSGNGNDSR